MSLIRKFIILADKGREVSALFQYLQFSSTALPRSPSGKWFFEMRKFSFTRNIFARELGQENILTVVIYQQEREVSGFKVPRASGQDTYTSHNISFAKAT